jgi:hypothetical protein
VGGKGDNDLLFPFPRLNLPPGGMGTPTALGYAWFSLRIYSADLPRKPPHGPSATGLPAPSLFPPLPSPLPPEGKGGQAKLGTDQSSQEWSGKGILVVS